MSRSWVNKCGDDLNVLSINQWLYSNTKIFKSLNNFIVKNIYILLLSSTSLSYRENCSFFMVILYGAKIINSDRTRLDEVHFFDAFLLNSFLLHWLFVMRLILLGKNTIFKEKIVVELIHFDLEFPLFLN